eukprot:scaffold4103_cov248-Ochromonas_danica.AAC.14
MDSIARNDGASVSKTFLPAGPLPGTAPLPSSDDLFVLDEILRGEGQCGVDWTGLSALDYSSIWTTSQADLNSSLVSSNWTPNTCSACGFEEMRAEGLAVTSIDEEDDIGDDVNLNPPPRRRRLRRRCANPFPRILKRDIRRLFPSMYINVINSRECETINDFLSTFCVKSCKIIDGCNYAYFCDSLANLFGPITIHGLASFMSLMGLKMSSLPDGVVQLEDSYIQHQLHTPGSKVLMKVRVQGTLIRQALLNLRDENNNMLVVPRLIYQILEVAGRLPSCFAESAQVSGEVLSNISLDIHVTVVFFFDNDHRIYRIEKTAFYHSNPPLFVQHSSSC